MPCPTCGASTTDATMLAPGLWRCEKRLVIDDDLIRPCATQYSEGSQELTLGLCWCGMGAVAECTGGCGRSLCGEHALRPERKPPFENYDAVPITRVLEGVPSARRARVTFENGWRLRRGVACEDCRLRDAHSAVAKLGVIDLPTDAITRYCVAVKEMDTGTKCPPDFPLPWDIAPDLDGRFLALARSGTLGAIEVVEKRRRGQTTETSEAFAIAGCARQGYGGGYGADASPGTVVVNLAGRFTYGSVSYLSDGLLLLQGGPGKDRNGKYTREWFASFRECSWPNPNLGVYLALGQVFAKDWSGP